jgi:phospholipid/cholesterol/gamma-HCH transport system substrate-binding protein
MNNIRERALVGLFVLIASALLIGTILAVAGTFSSGGVPHHVFFKSAGGLVPGAMVRYAGMKAGKVDAVHVDPKDSTRIEIDLRVSPGIPVKTDSIAKIATLGALSDNYVEIGAGTKDAPLAPPGSELNSVETFGIGDLGDMLAGLKPEAQQVMQNLNQRLTELQVTIARVNDLLDDKNRENISSSLGNLNGMLADSRPKVSASLANIQVASAKLVPLLDNLKATMNEANTTLSHIDAVVVENRQDIRETVIKLKETMFTASALLEQLKSTADLNTDNIDQIILNVRQTTENMRELTATLKANPATLLRGTRIKDRKPGQPVK